MSPPRAKAPPWLEWGLLGLLVVLFLGLASRQLERPGLFWDEGDAAAYGMEIALDLPPTWTDWSVALAGRTWPLRVRHPYDFVALPIYWSALAFKAGGVGVAVLRWSALLIGAAVLIALYALSRLWLGPEAAFAACLLLAVDPAFALTSRLAYWAVEFFLLPPALTALVFFSLWHRRRRAWALCAGAFCWGLTTSMTTKAVAFLIAYPVLYLLLVPRKDRPSPRMTAAAAACAALGAADFIAYNAARGMPTFKRLLGALAAPTAGGVDNFAVARNLAVRGRQVLDLLGGTVAVTADGGVSRGNVLLILFAAAFAAMIWRCASRRPFRGRGFILLVLGLIALLFLETAFTPMGLDSQHLLILLPFAVLPVAAALDWLRTEVERRMPGKGTLAAAALLALPVVSALRADASYFSRLKSTGGEGELSDSIYDLAGYLDRSGILRPVALTHEVSRNVYLITAGRVKPLTGHAWSKGITPPLLEAYAALASDPAARFIGQPSDEPGDPFSMYLEAFRGVVEKSGRRLAIEKEFADSRGRTMYFVWRVEERSQRTTAVKHALHVEGPSRRPVIHSEAPAGEKPDARSDSSTSSRNQ